MTTRNLKSGKTDSTQGGRFPDWQSLYEEADVRTMPWYTPHLDADLVQGLHREAMQRGDFLDLGTGPGTQAVELANHGFRVTATDLSEAAIGKARPLSAEVNWVVDDILHSSLSTAFDGVFDRGCFHVLPPECRPDYVKAVHDLLKPSGVFFLKCFSTEQPEADRGPHRFSEADLSVIFGSFFTVKAAWHTRYFGTLSPEPKALFAILKPTAT